MKRNTSKAIVGIVLAAVAVVVIFYSRGPSDKSAMKIGVIAPLTGQYGFLGESIRNALLISVGGEKNIQLVFEDDRFDGKVGLTAFHKLTDIDHVDLLINVSSPTLEAITPLVHQSGLPVIQIFEAKEHAADTIFQMMPFSYALFSELGSLASKHFDRIAVAYNGATDVLEVDKKYFESGISDKSKIVAEEKIVSDSDYRSAVAKILAANPDAVTNIFALNDGIRFIKEFNTLKGSRKISLICDANTEFAIGSYIKALGTSTFEGCLSTNLPNITSDGFKKAYKAAYEADPAMGADWGYDAITIARSLLGKPKGEWAKDIQAISFDGVSGKVSFDETGTRPAVWEDHIFREGKFVKLGE